MTPRQTRSRSHCRYASSIPTAASLAASLHWGTSSALQLHLAQVGSVFGTLPISAIDQEHVCGSPTPSVFSGRQDFLGYSRTGKPKVLVMSYPCFRGHKAEVYKLGIDVLMCDEVMSVFVKHIHAQSPTSPSCRESNEC